MSNDSLCLQVFTKSPRHNDVKTRLAGVLSLVERQSLQTRLTRHTLTTCSRMKAKRELWCYPGVDRWLERAAIEFGFEARAQEGLDLGARMLKALNSHASLGKTTLLMGTDCPAIDASVLQTCVSSIQNNPTAVTFVPAVDGGFPLIGCRRPVPPEAFEKVEWGTSTVMALIQKNLASINIQAVLLEPLPDIDRPEDLAMLPAHLRV